MAAVALDFTGLGEGRHIAWQQHYWIDDEPMSRGLDNALPPRLADLIDLAMAVYVADRLIHRGSEQQADAEGLVWTRSFRLRLGVRDLSFWSKPWIAERLGVLLEWLTDDRWEFEFVARQAPSRPAELQQHLLSGQHRGAQAVAMFSGGADSLAGALDLIHEHPERRLILVSATSNRRLGAVQRALVTELRARAGQVCWIRVPFALTHQTQPNTHETTQRSRGFVFFALGACVAALSGASKLLMFENGIGAINLPYLEVQFGAQSNRTAHPKTHRLVSALISSVLDSPFEIENPFLFLTKADVCAAVNESDLPLLGLSESCDNFGRRVAVKTRCGICTSCVLRVQALSAAQCPHVERFERYQHHPLAEPRSEALAVTLIQMDRIWRCLRQDDPWRALVRTFPVLAGLPQAVMGDSGELLEALTRRRVMDLYRRYVAEWKSLICQGQYAYPMEACS